MQEQEQSTHPTLIVLSELQKIIKDKSISPIQRFMVNAEINKILIQCN